MPADVEDPLTVMLRTKREAKACDGNGGSASGTGTGTGGAGNSTGTTRAPIDARNGPPTLPPS